MQAAQIIASIRNKIGQDDLIGAAEQLQALCSASRPLLEEALLQQGRLAHLERQLRLGGISHTEAGIARNQVRAGLLGLLGEVERREIRSDVRPESAQTGTSIIQQADKIYNIDHIDNANFS